MTLATTYEDQPITYDNGAPVNNASGSFNGTTTIRTAIRNSVNTVAVQCFEDVTPSLARNTWTTLDLLHWRMVQKQIPMPMAMFTQMPTCLQHLAV